jgi:transcriptional regulator with XRE-family HTH domain
MDINSAVIGAFIKKIRTNAKLPQAAVAAYLTRHGSKATFKIISDWERGKTNPTAVQLLLVCECCGAEGISGISQTAHTFYPELNSDGLKKLDEYAMLLLKDNRYLKNPVAELPKRYVPLYDLPVSAGTGMFLDSDHYELIEADSGVPYDATFAVRVSGDSMTPRIADGQIIYIKQQQAIDDGEIGIFMLNGDAFCKKLSGGKLVSLNSNYTPITIGEEDDLRVYGKVIG